MKLHNNHEAAEPLEKAKHQFRTFALDLEAVLKSGLPIKEVWKKGHQKSLDFASMCWSEVCAEELRSLRK